MFAKLPQKFSRPGGKFDTLNPYLLSGYFFLQRLLWDIRPVAWRNRQRLKKIKNTHHGEKAVILCNGPSLMDVDFGLLSEIYTFGLNKINLLFDQNDFRPSCIVAVNPFVLEQNREFYSKTELPLFLEQNALRFSIPFRNNTFLLSNCGIPFFSRDCSMSIFQGYTVTYVAMQLAYHMGFSKIAVVGCDHSYVGINKPNQVIESTSEGLSHFCKSYFPEGQLWQYPDMRQSEVYFSLAKDIYEDDGRVIYNASSRTRLDIFPKIKLEKFLDDRI